VDWLAVLRPLPSPSEIDQQTQQTGGARKQLCDGSLPTVGSAIGVQQGLKVSRHLGTGTPLKVRCHPFDDRRRPREERRQLHVQRARQTCQGGDTRRLPSTLLKLGNEISRHVGTISQLLLRQPTKAPQPPKLIADRLPDLA
jgi:hypothetical protein